jgi:hypothetical protein
MVCAALARRAGLRPIRTGRSRESGTSFGVPPHAGFRGLAGKRPRAFASPPAFSMQVRQTSPHTPGPRQLTRVAVPRRSAHRRPCPRLPSPPAGACPDVAVERPVPHLLLHAMLDRVEVDIGDVAGEVRVVANGMLPVAGLPKPIEVESGERGERGRPDPRLDAAPPSLWIASRALPRFRTAPSRPRLPGLYLVICGA